MIWRWPEEQAERAPDRVAIRFGEAALTRAELAARILACAAGLAAQGVGRGDRVAFLGHNHPAQIVLLFACARLGAILLPLNWRLAVPELRAILADAGARLLCAMPDLHAAAEAAAPEGCAVLSSLPEGGADAPAVGRGEDPVLLVYTSGTTGQPKGAVLDQDALLHNALNAEQVFALTPFDAVLTVLPLFHVGGLNIQTLPALRTGAEVLLHPRFDPDAFLDAVASDRPSLSLLVPAAMRALVAHPRWPAARLRPLRAVGAGSSEVPLPLIEAFHAKGVPVQQVYGATETGPIAIAQSREEALAAPGSIGRPAPHAEARLSPAGEILVRGPAVTRFYWGGGAALDAEGWFATGDAGRVDAEGRWWFTGRLKHLIISGGENIHPAEVERVLAEAPGIADCAVVGRPDPRWGEVPVAVVVPGEGFDAAAALRFLEGRIARFKHPREVIAVAELPRTALGKVATAALKAMVAAR